MIAWPARFHRYMESAFADAGQRHADQTGRDAVVEPVAGSFGDASFAFDPTGTTAFHVSRFEILFRERLFLFDQLNTLDSRFGWFFQADFEGWVREMVGFLCLFWLLFRHRESK